MILLKEQILRGIKEKKIIVEPFIEDNLAVNSLDVRLSKHLLTYVPTKIIKLKNGKKMMVKDMEILRKMDTYIEEIDNIYISMREDNKIFETEIPEDGVILLPNMLFLGSTMEKAGSDYYIPMYEGRSSIGRLGLESHISAGFGDLGFKSNWTLEITVVDPLEVFPEKRIGQVYFLEGDENEVKIAMDSGFEYKGKYTDQPKPQASKSYLDKI